MLITKSNIESYKIRYDDKFYWADINIDAGESSGRIQISSDFGDYQYYFGSCGMMFKEFLCKIEMDYLSRKFGQSDWFDLDATINNLKSRIFEYTDSKDKQIRQELLDELSNLEESSSIEEFICKMNNSTLILQMEDYNPHVYKTINPVFKNFWTHIWIPFINELKKENKNN